MEEELEMEKRRPEIQKKSYEIRREIIREERYKNVKLLKIIIMEFKGTDIPLLEPV